MLDRHGQAIALPIASSLAAGCRGRVLPQTKREMDPKSANSWGLLGNSTICSWLSSSCLKGELGRQLHGSGDGLHPHSLITHLEEGGQGFLKPRMFPLSRLGQQRAKA